jgi:hypothetical protein
MANQHAQIKKSDEELQIVWSEVYAPMIPDSTGDYMTADEIRKIAYDFLIKRRTAQIDVNHDNVLYGCFVVESFIAREDDQIFIPGSWVLGVHIPPPEIWAMVKSGELNGFSMEIYAVRTPTSLLMEIPEVIAGLTEITEGHDHRFEVSYDDDGSFVGGKTNTVAGHYHEIVRGTVTEPAHNHTHRFSYVEVLADAQG